MSRSRTSALALVIALAAALPGAALAQETEIHDQVRDLVLPVQDLTLETTSLDRSVRTQESSREVKVTLAADVLFRFDRASLTARARSRIAEAVEKIRQGDPARVQVVGHTDSKGSDAYNDRLSRRRAASVARALRAALGARAPALDTEGRGEREPVAPNAKADGSDNPRGRARNRRVTVNFAR
jgi:outer membrane protein OmpA-like peptidoglycan-associated protein